MIFAVLPHRSRPIGSGQAIQAATRASLRQLLYRGPGWRTDRWTDKRNDRSMPQRRAAARHGKACLAQQQGRAKHKAMLTQSSHLSYLALIPDAQNNKTPASRSEGAHARYRITYPGFGLLDTAQQGL
ncbi:hypothetical protein C8035_v002159 [Colletotrichum spinosum]|uniref:Uncharacterized protein n=1 Tax=Colletotrichum spinosum TaxID=1347390 RepID=A0A4R8QXP9_9PEZI|nr:hypothetical protein C8035_v002159 [Colletotrichum spinosum]